MLPLDSSSTPQKLLLTRNCAQEAKFLALVTNIGLREQATQSKKTNDMSCGGDPDPNFFLAVSVLCLFYYF